MSNRKPSEKPRYDRPCADKGLTSYRYPKPWGGWIMIGATDIEDALNEAARSTSAPISSAALQVWSGNQYIPATHPAKEG